jgi:MerR family transcriptional regulator, light-induced transcriptional regulator
MFSNKPIYNLRVVLRETGIKADVLRAWERRYGLPMPHRSSGGHRLYSERDIATIKWLIVRQSEGLSISSAVELWREKDADSQDPLSEMTRSDQSAALTLFTSDSTLDKLRTQWLEACTAFNEPAAEQVLNLAFSLHPVEKVVKEVIQFGMRDLGELWFIGDVTVQQEHFTSALALQRMETLISATPPPTLSKTVLLACPQDEWHTFSLVLLNLLLRRKGYHVVFLGANVPINHLNEAVESVHPELMIFASQQLASASKLQQAAQSLIRDQVQVAYGGRVFNTVPTLRKRIPGHFLGETIDESLQMVDQLLQSPRSIPDVEVTSPAYLQLAQDFKEKRGLVESSILDEYKARGVSSTYIDIANLHLGNELISAFELGDVDYLTADMTWLKGLLTRNNIPPEQLNPYLIAYGESVRRTMNGYSVIFTNWINAIIQEDGK